MSRHALRELRGLRGLRGLSLLRARIREAAVPAPRPGNLRIATWNIREFGKRARRDDSIALIAELIGTFDLVSIVELREDLGDLARVVRVLGAHWRVVYSDYLRDAGGNHERSAFVFNTRRVRFTGLASTAECPRKKRGEEYACTVPWWRPPYLASFAACEGPFDFLLVTAHVRWGKHAAAREAEVAALGAWVLGRAQEPHFGDPDVLVVGDFNVDTHASTVLRALETRGLVLAPGLEHGVTTDLARWKRYDQILCVRREQTRASFSGRAGCVDFYRGEHRALLGTAMSKARFTRQVSDHLPLWAELLVPRRGTRDQVLGA